VRSETVYAKTARGIEELEHRSLGLGATTRRLLILIDGKRTVAQLVHDNAGSMDVAQALDQLRSHGLIAEVGQESSPATSSAPASPPAATADHGGSIRGALIEMCSTVLGEQHASRIATKLESIEDDDIDQFAQAVDKCVRLIRLTIDEDKAEDFRRQAEVILRSSH
jgi:hypothetical protein